MSYGVATRGSEWREIRVRDVDTGKDTRDVVKWVKSSTVSWTRDNKGFFYSGYDAPPAGQSVSAGRVQRVFYHKVGTQQSQDPIVFDRADKPNWVYDTQVTDDGEFAIITIHEGNDPRSRIYFVFLENPKKPLVTNPIVRLIDKADAQYEFVHNMGDYFLVATDLGAPKGRLVQFDINNPESTRWVTLLPENADTLESVDVAGEQIVAAYKGNGRWSMRVYGMPQLNDPRRNRGTSGPGGRLPGPSGQARAPGTSTDPRMLSAPGYPFMGEIPLPATGMLEAISARPRENELFYSIVVPGSPRTIYKYDMKKRTNELYKTSRQ
jgi:protease II